MKWVLIAAIVVVLAGAGIWVWGHRGKPGHEIDFAWNHEQNPSVPDCSAAVHKSCMSGFTLTDETDGEVITSAIPMDARTYTYRPEWEIPVGFQHVYSLRTNGFDSNGAPIQSQPAKVTVENPKWKFGQANGAAAVR